MNTSSGLIRGTLQVLAIAWLAAVFVVRLPEAKVPTVGGCHWQAPDPRPEPTPPPAPRTNPFTDDVPRVLIVYDPQGVPLTASQHSAIYGKDARDAMTSFAGADGWRIWTKDTAPNRQDGAWQEAMKRQRSSYPWVLIGKGGRGFEGPLPADLAGEIAKYK